ncbi:radial spoke head 10 homolog B-like [Orbicella faveolata]|uniref:radial spoke head 10 homolog B-like n=1 Tax=Orbicella faveolata TaxID=48498 RepID=UPI0009E57ED6|nr:radial spoke head 10 homolog B-like [Orbicella faveolata]
MGLCISSQPQDYEGFKRYDGGTLLCFKHGEGTYLYENGDMYKGEWKWNKKHGHGVYTHVNGEIKRGYFYQNEYIGQDPGNLFAATSCFAGFSGKSSEKPLASDEEIRNQIRLDVMRGREEERASQREERRKRRDELRQKYNL